MAKAYGERKLDVLNFPINKMFLMVTADLENKEGSGAASHTKAISEHLKAFLPRLCLIICLIVCFVVRISVGSPG